MTIILKRLLAGAAVVGTLCLNGLPAARAADSTLSLSDAWSRPTANTTMAGVVYLKVTDSGEPTMLIAVSTPIAEHAEMHHSMVQDGMMMMMPVKSLPIAPDSPITFSPGAYHIMLTGLHQALAVGQSFPITLFFADGRKATTTVTIRSMQSVTEPASGNGGMGNMKM